MKVTLYAVHGVLPMEIRPARHDREWMDATPGKSAYRCLPLPIANSYGWELLCPTGFAAIWKGGPAADQISIYTNGEEAPALSDFGFGILTFQTHIVPHTEPGVDLYVMGPANAPKHGIIALEGVCEADHMYETFTMNWLFTAPGGVAFAKGEPVCRIFPVLRDTLPSVEIETRPLADDVELMQKYLTWREVREAMRTKPDRQPNEWQKDYYREATTTRMHLAEVSEHR